MPGWLKALAHVNPLTYEVDAMRALMVEGGRSLYGIGLDLIVLAAATMALMALASRLYPSLAR
jgi:ABC-2 type transport system permease protein